MNKGNYVTFQNKQTPQNLARSYQVWLHCNTVNFKIPSDLHRRTRQVSSIPLTGPRTTAGRWGFSSFVPKKAALTLSFRKAINSIFPHPETQCNTTAWKTSSSNTTCSLPPAEQHLVPVVALSWHWWPPCSQAGNTNSISLCLAQPLWALGQVALKLLSLLCETSRHYFCTDFTHDDVKQPAGHGCVAGDFSETKLTAVIQITACWASLGE